MKKCTSCLSTGLLLLRLLIGGIFMYHGLSKFGADAGMIEFVGGAFHDLGLTFLSMATWVQLMAIGETLAGIMFILGFFAPVASVLVVIIMLGAMNTKGRSPTTFVGKDFMLAIIAIVIACTGVGKYAVQPSLGKKCCGGSSDQEAKKQKREVIDVE